MLFFFLFFFEPMYVNTEIQKKLANVFVYTKDNNMKMSQLIGRSDIIYNSLHILRHFPLMRVNISTNLIFYDVKK